MQLMHDWDLQAFNTLAVPSRAEYFCVVRSLAELDEALRWAAQNQLPVNVLGGGSNVILAPIIKGLTIRIQLLGKSITPVDANRCLVHVSAGENWHALVEWSLAQGLYGLENLALIPGTVGAAPVQNIGAYGVEVGRLIDSVDVFSRRDYTTTTLTATACEFAYRESIFKTQLRDQMVITQVTLRLSTIPRVELSYPALQQTFEQHVGGSEQATPHLVFETVCRIRRAKLPDPQTLPNCGSFFKNPIIPRPLFQSLQANYPHMPSYSAPDKLGEPQRKLAAAWLIDQVGWKGRNRKDVGVHHQQALVLTNPKRQSAQSVLDLAEEIQQSVSARFGVTLEIEPQRMGFSA
jgi:UDP-N-acetylmuramate dehydrogenase